jgi:hypothetical protein
MLYQEKSGNPVQVSIYTYDHVGFKDPKIQDYVGCICTYTTHMYVHNRFVCFVFPGGNLYKI